MKDVLSKHLVFRDVVSCLFEKINAIDGEQVLLDFSQIESISRSFAQEYIQQRDQQTIKITEIHMSSQVKKMFDSVKTAQRKSTPLSFDNKKEISIHDFLHHNENKSAK